MFRIIALVCTVTLTQVGCDKFKDTINENNIMGNFISTTLNGNKDKPKEETNDRYFKLDKGESDSDKEITDENYFEDDVNSDGNDNYFELDENIDSNDLILTPKEELNLTPKNNLKNIDTNNKKNEECSP